MAGVSVRGWQMTAELSETCYENAASSLGHVNENDEECLRAAWERLGVGKDGFLDRRELALVCECIGMEKVEEEVGWFLVDLDAGQSE
jgi:Ca2+-binding EF-hand superfamily protein